MAQQRRYFSGVIVILLRSFGVALILLVFAGCSTTHYLFQAAKGQWAISNRSKPISEVLKNERTPLQVRKLLAEIERIKAFGQSKGLRPTRNYQEYVALDRPAAVWVVSACEPLKFQSRQWSFPIVGSFTYLGWFDLNAAKDFAQEMKAQGLDVDLRGASAYSTLGWFRDPVFSSMLSKGPEAIGYLVNTVLHESVHTTVYISGQSIFNESLAEFVAGLLTRDYFLTTRGKGSEEETAYLKSENDFQRRRFAYHEAYQELDGVYQGKLSDGEKLLRKKEILEALQKREPSTREINNATLIQYKTYTTAEKEFQRLYEACHQDLVRFLNRLGTLRSEDFGKEQNDAIGPYLLKIVEKGC